jgi:hypothetical protein
MKQALFVVSGVAIGLLTALVAVASSGKSCLPQADAQAAGPGDAQSSGNMIMGIGGASPNQNDLCWVLVKGKNKAGEGDRYSLSLYKADNKGVFDLTDVREITYDGKLVQLNHPNHNKDLTPQALKKKIEQNEHREGEGTPPRTPNNP